MDALTARNLARLRQADANYHAKLQREQDEHKLSEAPAFITGYDQGKYQVQRLGQDPTNTGVPVTNGLLQNGQRVTTIGQFVDGVPRVKPVIATVTPVIATGKIKYLYSIVNPTTSKTEYWIGGWQKKPVQLTTLPSFYAPAALRLNNGGSSRYTIDGSVVTGVSPIGFPETFTGYFFTFDQNNQIIYQSRELGANKENFFVVAFISNSFIYGNVNTSFGYLHGSWATCFKGMATTGYTLDFANIPQYWLPNLLSPHPAESYAGSTGDTTNYIYDTFAVNRAGDRGVGRLAESIYSNSQLYWLENGVMDATETITLLPLRVSDLKSNYKLDCFDTTFSAFNRADVNLAATATKQVSIDIYTGLTGVKAGTITTKVFPLPQSQRSQTPVLLDVSFAPS